MKSKKKQQQLSEPASQPVEVKTYTVNCPNCGASLDMKNNGYAYLCPVCNKLLYVKTGSGETAK